MTDQARPEGLNLRAWLSRVADLPGLAEVTVSQDEQRVLLELARIAAHQSERIAAPITTYLVGLSLAGRTPQERAAALQAFVSALDDQPAG
jgi:Domain of unknown function (DUF6457)